MKKTPIRLSDGRELIFYDERPSDRTSIADDRRLPEVSTTSEIRHDPILDEWVVIASHRQARTHLPPIHECPLCPSRGEMLTEIPADDYDVVVFENRFPSMTTGAQLPVGDVTLDPDLVERRPGSGRCEVVLFTSDHDQSFSSLSVDRVKTVMEVWADRTEALSKIPEVEQIFPFENCGTEIGVTLSHPHGQIYAYPFVTPRTRTMLASAARHRAATGGDLFADVLEAERKAELRVVGESEAWTAFVPATARWPVEVHLYPNRKVADLTELSDEERSDFAGLYLDILQRFDALYDTHLPYIAAWQQAPVRRDRDLGYLHLELFSIKRAADRLKYLAGSESGMGVFINDSTPEQIAERLRGV